MLRLRKRHLPFIALLCGVIVAMLPSLASSATTASVEALNEGGGIYGETHRWSPAQVAVTTSGGVVTFANKSAAVPHGIIWKSAPATPTCEEGAGKVPVGVGHFGYSWSGACTFTQEGAYSYYCSVHGEAMSGTVYVNATGTLPPLATTGAAGEETETAATLHGTVNPEGQPTSYYFAYGTSTSYGQKTTELSAGEDSVNHQESAMVTGLLPGTTYHFQIVATYASGASTVLGGDQIFTTVAPPGAPTATTGAANEETETGAKLHGTVNPDGKPTTYFFNYGTSTSYGQKTAELPIGEDSTNHAVAAVLSGLAPGTTYHFQLVAHNALGDAPGSDRTFKTASPETTTTTTTTTSQSQPPPSTTTSTTTTATTTPPPAGSGSNLGVSGGSPLAGSASAALKLASAQRGSAIHGTLAIAPAGAGARLEVDLLSASAALARSRGHARQVRIGRLVRASLVPGTVSFSVPLTAQAKRALGRHHRLPVIVQITVTPANGKAVTLTRGVVLRH